MLYTVPMVIHVWLSPPTDYAGAIQALIVCGGDTDSTAAIAGEILGASLGKEAIPPPWLTHLSEWPRTVAWMKELAEQLALAITTGQALRPLGLGSSLDCVENGIIRVTNPRMIRVKDLLYKNSMNP